MNNPATTVDFPMCPTEEPPEDTYQVAFETINGQIDRQSRLISSFYQRASILIGASGISTALLTRENLAIVWLLPIGLFIAAIVLAVISLLFSSAQQVEPTSILEGMDAHEPKEFKAGVLNSLVGMYESIGETIPKRTRLLSTAMILFTSGWLVSFLILAVLALDSIGGTLK